MSVGPIHPRKFESEKIKISASKNPQKAKDKISTLGKDSIKVPERFYKEGELEFDLPILPIPRESSFYDQNIVVLKDSYKGLLPLNGIRESDFHQAEELYQKICSGKTSIKIDNGSPFKKEVEGMILKLLTRKVGRDLIKELCAVAEPLFITNESHYMGCCFVADENKIFMNLSKRYYHTLSEKGEKKAVPYDPAIILAHEMIHALRHRKGIWNLGPPPTLASEFHQQEEQETIFGLKNPIFFADDQNPTLETFEPYEIFDYHYLNENTFLSAFGLPIRINHEDTLVKEGEKFLFKEPFDAAVEQGDIQKIKLILEKTTDLQKIWKDQKAPVFWKICETIPFRKYPAVEVIAVLDLLIQRGADPKEKPKGVFSNSLDEAILHKAPLPVIEYLQNLGLNTRFADMIPKKD